MQTVHKTFRMEGNPFAAFAYKPQRAKVSSGNSPSKTTVKREREAGAQPESERVWKKLTPIFRPDSPSRFDFEITSPKKRIRSNEYKNYLKQLECIHEYRLRPSKRASVDDFHEYLDSKAPDQIFLGLIASVLSTQTRDTVALETAKKFEKKFPTIESTNVAPLVDIEDCVKSVNFCHNKAKFIKGIAMKLRTDFDGKVPIEFNDLCSLPGVGPKISHLTRSVLFGIDDTGVVVDSNVYRVSKRIGWSSEKDDSQLVSKGLAKWWPKHRWTKSTQDVVGFGQLICTPKNPKCNICPCRETCMERLKKNFT